MCLAPMSFDASLAAGRISKLPTAPLPMPGRFTITPGTFPNCGRQGHEIS